MSSPAVIRPLASGARHAGRSFSSSPSRTLEVKKLGVIGAGQMVGLALDHRLIPLEKD